MGVSTGKWLQNIGAFGNFIPGLILLGLGAYALTQGPSASPLHLKDMVPDLGNFSEINLWASIAFAFAGLELAPVMAGETKDPARSLRRSILIAAPFILVLYILGTVAVLVLVPSHDINTWCSAWSAAGDRGGRGENRHRCGLAGSGLRRLRGHRQPGGHRSVAGGPRLSPVSSSSSCPTTSSTRPSTPRTSAASAT